MDYFITRPLSDYVFSDRYNRMKTWLERLKTYIAILEYSYFFIMDDSVNRNKIKLITHAILDEYHTEGHNLLEAARTLHSYAKKNFHYARDPIGYEWFITPLAFLKQTERIYPTYGDCDDHAVAIACMLASIGILPYFIFIAKQPFQFGHIITSAAINKKLYPMESTIKKRDVKFGEIVKAAMYCIKCPYNNFAEVVVNNEISKTWNIPNLFEFKCESIKRV